jgi:hypothetical protein
MNSAVSPLNVSKNSGAEILNDLNSVKNMIEECLPLNSIPTKFKLFLAGKL